MISYAPIARVAACNHERFLLQQALPRSTNQPNSNAVKLTSKRLLEEPGPNYSRTSLGGLASFGLLLWNALIEGNT